MSKEILFKNEKIENLEREIESLREQDKKYKENLEYQLKVKNKTIGQMEKQFVIDRFEGKNENEILNSNEVREKFMKEIEALKTEVNRKDQ